MFVFVMVHAAAAGATRSSSVQMIVSKRVPMMPLTMNASRIPATARRDRLIQMIGQRRYINVSDAASELQVSEMTIRRDLDRLAETGLISRDHGGATARAPETAFDADEPAFEVRGRRQAEAKQQIARTAAGLVHSGQTIGIDTGSTTHRFARELLDISGLRLFCSNLRTAGLLAGGKSPVYSLGGLIRPNEFSVCGPVASSQLATLWLDTVFLGVSGLTSQGIFDYTLEDAEIKRAFMARSSQVVVLCDASKFDHRSLVLVSPFQNIHALVTDAPLPEHLAEPLAQAGVRVILAGDEASALPDPLN
jgi:DeoR/GlpR family transcriptional regulator of sugar metabolism